MSSSVTLVPARPEDRGLLENLLELYIHDLSEVFQIAPGEDGRFGYERLPLYFTETDRRFPFLIRRDGRMAGFAFGTRGSPASDDPNVLDVAEFFVVRGYRRFGVGREAALALFRRMPGDWLVRVSEGNRAGLPFWEGVIRELTGGAFTATQRPGTPHPWRVFAFKSGG